MLVPPFDSSKGSHLLPTRPARRPAPYASDTSPGVTPPSGPRLISVCIQPSPWARRSVGVAEHGGSRFLRPDPSPWYGRRGSGTFSTSHECPPGETPTLHPRPFRPLFFLCCPVGRGTASHGTRPTSPWSRTRLLCFPRPFFSSWGNCRPGVPYFHSMMPLSLVHS